MRLSKLTRSLLNVFGFLAAAVASGQAVNAADPMYNFAVKLSGGTPVSTGTVTSVGLAVPAEFNLSGSPITTSGTIQFAWQTQLKNLVLASPDNSNGVPSFRAIAPRDLGASAASSLCLVASSATAMDWGSCGGGGGGAFSGITSGTNTSATMTCGTGCTMTTSGSGSLTATAVPVGGISGLGTGVGTWLASPTAANFNSIATVASLLDQIGSTRGSVLYRGASGWAALTPGTNGAALRSNGSGADPSYGTIGVGAGGTGLTSGTSGGVPTFTASGTLTSSGALSSNCAVLGGGAGAVVTTAAGLCTDGTSAVNLGVAGTSVGKVVLANATSGTITMQPVTGALGTVTLSVPATTGTLLASSTFKNHCSITVENPGAAESLAMCYVTGGGTITNVHGVVKGSSPSVTYNIGYGTSIASLTNVTTTPSALTNATTGTDATLNNTAIPTSGWLYFTTSAQSGTVNFISVTVEYTTP